MIWAVPLSTMDLIAHCLTPGVRSMVFGVYLNSVTLDGPLVQTVLYLHDPSSEANPKAISERTSYLQVRLEFHRYPQLIPAFFNIHGFGPPVCFTTPSTWSWVGHLVSGLHLPTEAPCSDSLSLRLRLFILSSQANVTRRFILQKARHYPLTGFD